MAGQNQKKQDDNQDSIDSTIVGIAEEVAIAGVTVAGTIGQKNRKTRRKANKALINVKGHASDYIKTLKVKPNAEEGIHTIKKIATDTRIKRKNQ